MLFLDFGLRLGIATDGVYEGVPETLDIPIMRPDGNKAGGFDFGACADAFERRLSALISDTMPTMIGYEEPLDPRRNKFTNANSIRIMQGFAFMTDWIAYRKGIDCRSVNVRTIKTQFAGTHSATKEDMIARCRQLRWDIHSDNEADAAAGWWYLKAVLDPKFRPAPGLILR